MSSEQADRQYIPVGDGIVPFFFFFFERERAATSNGQERKLRQTQKKLP